jgi:hypothetical protein
MAGNALASIGLEAFAWFRFFDGRCSQTGTIPASAIVFMKQEF